jgi:Holliday junction resolvase YEN1
VKLDGDNVALYTANALGNHPCVSLTEGGLLLIALLIGGDYDVVSVLYSLDDFLLLLM